jgi:hypothetical protein
MKLFFILLICINAKAAIVTTPLTDAQLRASPVVVSGTFSAAPPVGGATSALQIDGNNLLTDISTKLTAPIAVSGSITTSVVFPSSQTVNQGTSPWITSGVVSVANQITGFSTSALQTSGNASLVSIDSKLTSPLTVSGTVQATQSGIWNISSILNPISGLVSATITNQITDYATETTQSQNLTELQAINTELNTQTTALNSIDSKLTAPLIVSGSLTTNVTFPSSQVVNQGTNPWITSGTTEITNFPAVQQVSQTGIVSVEVTNPVSNVTIVGIVPVSATGITPISGNVSVLNEVLVSGALTDAQLRASPVIVSGSLLATVTNPVSQVTVIASALPNNAATEITQLNNLNELQISNSISSQNQTILDDTYNFLTAWNPIVSGSVSITNPTLAVTQSTNPWIVSGSVSTNVVFPSSQVVNQGTSPWITSGTVSVSNFPAFIGLTDAELRASPVPVSGTVTANVTFPSVQDVSGSVQVSNFPLIQSVSTTGTNAVSGFVTINNPVTSVAVNNFPAFTGLTNAELRASPVVVSGSVSTNVVFPTSQVVNQGTDPWITSGTSIITNFPSVQAVSTTGINAVSGFVTVSNPVTSVSITGTPTVSFTNTSIGVTQSSSPWITSGTVSIVNSSLPVTIAGTLPVSTTGINAVSGSVTVNNPVTTVSATVLGQQRTPSYTSTTTTGTVSAGTKSVSFYNAGFFNATVLGTTLSAGDTITFQAPDQDTLGAIAYVATGTTLRILEVR